MVSLAFQLFYQSKVPFITVATTTYVKLLLFEQDRQLHSQPKIVPVQIGDGTNTAQLKIARNRIKLLRVQYK